MAELLIRRALYTGSRTVKAVGLLTRLGHAARKNLVLESPSFLEYALHDQCLTQSVTFGADL